MRFRRAERRVSTKAVEGILDMLANGEIRPVQQFPDSRWVARRLGMPRRTVRQATNELVRHGVLEVRRHNRLFISHGADDPQVADAVLARLAG
jgi:DNA-binding FadR family transcriptional regulator